MVQSRKTSLSTDQGLCLGSAQLKKLKKWDNIKNTGRVRKTSKTIIRAIKLLLMRTLVRINPITQINLCRRWSLKSVKVSRFKMGSFRSLSHCSICCNNPTTWHLKITHTKWCHQPIWLTKVTITMVILGILSSRSSELPMITTARIMFNGFKIHTS